MAPARSLALWWLRRDLRVADNEALTGACDHSEALLPVFCFDPRDVRPRRVAPEGLGVPKLGPLRCRFLLEGLVGLRRDLHQLQLQGGQRAGQEQERAGAGSCDGGSGGLVVRFGRPELMLPGLLSEVHEANKELRHVSVHHHLDVMEEGAVVEREVAEALRSWAARRGVGLSIHTYWDRTLYHPDDLPYHMYGVAHKAASQKHAGPASAGGSREPFTLPPNRDQARFRGIPGVMTDFRKATQAASDVRPSLPPPIAVPPLPEPFLSATLAPASTSAAAAEAAPAGELQPDNPVGSVPPKEKEEEERVRPGLTGGVVGQTAPPGPGHLGHIPSVVTEVYEAAGATGALRRLEEIVGVSYGGLLRPVDSAAAPSAPDPRTAFPFQAGQDSAARRLRYYVWGHPAGPVPEPVPGLQGGTEQPQAGAEGPCSPPSLLYFTNTRAQAVGLDSSTKLSPFVALGCITPRQIHEEVERVRNAASAAAAAAGTTAAAADASYSASGSSAAPQEGGGNGGGSAAAALLAPAAVAPPAQCDWLAMHLVIRDFFIYTALKEGEAMMDERGIMGVAVSWRRDADTFSRWARGLTGLPFVDANMRELAATGWMSNRGRQNVASLLSKDLGLDWRWGAELFECLLLDCDVAVNYCNWNYFAGIGNDPRNRHFKTVTQGMQYDEDAVLAATWLPELTSLPTALRHQPWSMSEADSGEYGVVLGRDYPLPMVDPAGHVGQLGGKRKTAGKRR